MIYYNPQDDVIGVLVTGYLIQIDDNKVYRVLTDRWVKIGSL